MFTFIRFHLCDLKNLERFYKVPPVCSWLTAVTGSTQKISFPCFRTIRWQKSPNTTQQEVAAKLKDRAPTISGKEKEKKRTPVFILQRLELRNYLCGGLISTPEVELQCHLLGVNHWSAEENLLLLLFLLSSFFIWKTKKTNSFLIIIIIIKKPKYQMVTDTGTLLSPWETSFESTNDRRGGTWLDDGQRHCSGLAVQLQQGLLNGLAERVLEARHRNPVGPVALSVAVCCRWSEQFICGTRMTERASRKRHYRGAAVWIYPSSESSGVQRPLWLSRLAASVRDKRCHVSRSESSSGSVLLSGTHLSKRHAVGLILHAGGRTLTCQNRKSRPICGEREKKKNLLPCTDLVEPFWFMEELRRADQKDCCWEVRGGPLWSLAAPGGCCCEEETQMLGNAGGSPVRCEPRDLWETWFHRWVQVPSGGSPGLWRHSLHLPCFLFSSISILFSRRFSSLSFFCLMRFRFSSSSGGKTLVRPSKRRPKTQTEHGPNLQTSPEFPWTEAVAAAPARRCWTHRWAAGEPGSDVGDGSPDNEDGVLKEELEGTGLQWLVVGAHLSDRVSDYLHHCCGDVVRTGLQAAVLTQQTADVHRMEEHLLAVVGWREATKMSSMSLISSK